MVCMAKTVLPAIPFGESGLCKRAALDMTENPGKREEDAGRRIMDAIDLSTYEDREALEEEYQSMVQQAVKASA